MKVFFQDDDDTRLSGLATVLFPHQEQKSRMGSALSEQLRQMSVHVGQYDTGTMFFLSPNKTTAEPDRRLIEFLIKTKFFSPQFFVAAANLANRTEFELVEDDAAYFYRTVAEWLHPEDKRSLSRTMKGIASNRMYDGMKVSYDGANLSMHGGELTSWILRSSCGKRDATDLFRRLKVPMTVDIHAN